MARKNYGSPLEHLQALSKGKIHLADGEAFHGKAEKHRFTCAEGHTFERVWQSLLHHQPRCPTCAAKYGFMASQKGGDARRRQQQSRITLPPNPFD